MATDRLLLGVEETVDVKQAQKNKENNENNRFTKQCFLLREPVSSTARSGHRYENT